LPWKVIFISYFIAGNLPAVITLSIFSIPPIHIFYITDH